jgi:hypothetical protein
MLRCTEARSHLRRRGIAGSNLTEQIQLDRSRQRQTAPCEGGEIAPDLPMRRFRSDLFRVIAEDSLLGV